MSLQFGDDMCSQVVTPSTVGELLVVVARSSKVAATLALTHTQLLSQTLQMRNWREKQDTNTTTT